jgi:hypothetical protein
VLGDGYKGVTYEVKRTNGPGTPYALKLTIAEEYEGRTHLPKVGRMVELAKRDRDHFPQIHECGPYEFVSGDDVYGLVYFVEDFIDGETLERVLEARPELVDANFLYLYVSEMLAALLEAVHCQDQRHSSAWRTTLRYRGCIRPSFSAAVGGLSMDGTRGRQA